MGRVYLSEAKGTCLVLAVAAAGGQAPLYALGEMLAARCGGATLLDLSPVPLPGSLPPEAPTLAAMLDAGSPAAPSPSLTDPRLQVLPGGALGPAQILGGAVGAACRSLAQAGAVLVLAPALHAELMRELFAEAQAVVFAGSGGLEPVLELRRTCQTLLDSLPATALALLAPPTGHGVTLTAAQVAEWLRPLHLCAEPGEAVTRILSGEGGGGSAQVALERLRRLREQAPPAAGGGGAAEAAADGDPEEEALLRRVAEFLRRRRRLQRLRRDAEALAAELRGEAEALQGILSL